MTTTPSSHEPGPGPDPEAERLAPLRAEIDRLDAEIVALLGERFAVVRQIAAVKARTGMARAGVGRAGLPADRPEREAEIRARLARLAEEEGLDPDLVQRLYGEIFAAAARLQEALGSDR